MIAVKSRFDLQDARSLGIRTHGVRAVHDKVHDHLLQLNAVAQYGREPSSQSKLDSNVSAPKCVSGEPQDFPNGLVDIERPIFQLAIPEKCSNAPDDIAGATPFHDDCVERFLRFL